MVSVGIHTHHCPGCGEQKLLMVDSVDLSRWATTEATQED